MDIIQQAQKVLDSFTENDFKKVFQTGKRAGTEEFSPTGTTSKGTKPKQMYDNNEPFYTPSPETFGYHLV